MLNGKPLLEYSIEVAKKIDQISDIFVSTDCEDIADVASKLGGKVIKRPVALASDTSAEWLSWRHAINYVTENFGCFDTFVSLPPTSPLRSVADVEAALDKLDSTLADICISVTPSSRSPYFNMVELSEDGNVEIAIKSRDNVIRRQDAPPLFDITTVVYAAKVNFVQQYSSIFEGKVVSILVPKNRAVDIDDIHDFFYAESILKSESYDA